MNAIVDALQTYGPSVVIGGLLVYIVLNGELEFRYPRKSRVRGRN